MLTPEEVAELKLAKEQAEREAERARAEMREQEVTLRELRAQMTAMKEALRAATEGQQQLQSTAIQSTSDHSYSQQVPQPSSEMPASAYTEEQLQPGPSDQAMVGSTQQIEAASASMPPHPNPINTNGEVGSSQQPPASTADVAFVQEQMFGPRNGHSNNLVYGEALVTPMPPQIAKEWHQSVPTLVRKHVIDRAIYAVLFVNDPAANTDTRMIGFSKYVRKSERDMYEKANTKREYYYLLAKMVFTMRKKLEERKKDRRQEEVQQRPQPLDLNPPLEQRPGPRKRSIQETKEEQKQKRRRNNKSTHRALLNQQNQQELQQWYLRQRLVLLNKQQQEEEEQDVEDIDDNLEFS